MEMNGLIGKTIMTMILLSLRKNIMSILKIKIVKILGCSSQIHIKYIQPYAKIVDMDFENYVYSENDLFFICFWNSKELQSWFKVNVFDYLSNYWNKTRDLITNYKLQ